ncbi:MAG: hypothetical protein JNL32_06810 [Candidatus Kapabacteria bacterium]|nr:hypothetical protein [Candidatus Kapabacteria bacterium]
MAKQTKPQSAPSVKTETRYVMIAPNGALVHDGKELKTGDVVNISSDDAPPLVEAGLLAEQQVAVAPTAAPPPPAETDNGDSGGENGNEGADGETNKDGE